MGKASAAKKTAREMNYSMTTPSPRWTRTGRRGGERGVLVGGESLATNCPAQRGWRKGKDEMSLLRTLMADNRTASRLEGWALKNCCGRIDAD